MEECETCHGSGAKPGTQPKTCPTCNGHGQVRMQQGFFSIQQTCPKCHGSGKVVTDPCGTCNGAGRTKKQKTLSVKIPAGVKDGTRIRVKNRGQAGSRGGPAGDLYVEIHIKQHPVFQRDGDDLHCEMPISFTTAALGGTFEVATLDGTQTRVKVTEGSQNGKQFRLKGKGMPILRQKTIGDMYIQVEVETPKNLNKRQRELLEEFEKTSHKETSPESHGFLSRLKEFFEGKGI